MDTATLTDMTTTAITIDDIAADIAAALTAADTYTYSDTTTIADLIAGDVLPLPTSLPLDTPIYDLDHIDNEIPYTEADRETARAALYVTRSL